MWRVCKPVGPLRYDRKLINFKREFLMIFSVNQFYVNYFTKYSSLNWPLWPIIYFAYFSAKGYFFEFIICSK